MNFSNVQKVRIFLNFLRTVHLAFEFLFLPRRQGASFAAGDSSRRTIKSL